MKKQLVTAIASVCLVAALGVGATLAYYTSVSAEKVNTFTIGKVDINLVEPKWDGDNGKDLVPGASVEKDPYIINTGASDGYMMLHVTGMNEMSEIGFTVMNGEADGYNYSNWELVDTVTGNPIVRFIKDENGADTDVRDYSLVDGYYVYIGTEDGAVAEGEVTEPLFTSVKLDEKAKELTDTQYMIVAKFVDQNGNLFTYKDPVTGATIEANADRTLQLADNKPIVKYTIYGVDDSTNFDSYAEDEEYVMANYKADASFVFNLTAGS